MKNQFKKLVILIFISKSAFSQVGIGTTIPNANAILELKSTNKALLLPRVANTTSIATPVNGMVIYAENPKCFKGYANNTWVDLTSCTPIVSALTLASPTYQGVSVINSVGIGYNNENIPSNSTITVNLTATVPTSYTLTATHAATGLTFSASGNLNTAGTFPIVLTNNNAFIPKTTWGTISLTLTGASNSITLSPRIDMKTSATNNWVEGVDFNTVALGTQFWMDRNLGALRVANAQGDYAGYGNYYQWGRPADGHEIIVRNGDVLWDAKNFNATVAGPVNTDTPTATGFINVASGDWRDDGNTNRWALVNQGPCPTGFRVPSQTDFQTFITENIITNSATAYTTILKLPAAGYRSETSGLLGNQGGVSSDYWTTTIDAANPTTRSMRFLTNGSQAQFGGNGRSSGFPARCIKN